jgi:exopolyphosphatase/pppGpp-phosphohydrolase
MSVENSEAASALEYARAVIEQERQTMQILGRDGHLIALSGTTNVLERVIVNLEQDTRILRDKIFQLQKSERQKEDYLQGILT